MTAMTISERFMSELGNPDVTGDPWLRDYGIFWARDEANALPNAVDVFIGSHPDSTAWTHNLENSLIAIEADGPDPLSWYLDYSAKAYAQCYAIIRSAIPNLTYSDTDLYHALSEIAENALTDYEFKAADH